MAVYKDIEFFVDGIDLGATAFKNYDFSRERSALDATVLGDSGKKYERGFKTGDLSASGIWDADTTNADEIHDVISAAFKDADTVQKEITISEGAPVQGDPAIMVSDIKTVKYGINSSLDNLIEANCEIKPNNGGEVGVWIFVGSDSGGGTDGTHVTNIVSSSNGGYFQAHFYEQSDSAATDMSITVQHASSLGAWADLVAAQSFGSITKSVGNLVAAGTLINRYLRCQITATGGKGYVVAAFVRR